MVLFCSVLPDIRKHCFVWRFTGSPVCPSDKKSIQMKMRMEHLWNDNERENLKCMEKNLPQYHIAHHKSHQGLARDRNRASAVSGRWLSPRAMTRPLECNINLHYTGLFEMIVGGLTTCHTQYTGDRSMFFFYLIEQHSKFCYIPYRCSICASFVILQGYSKWLSRF